jgi:hypothetical protein
LKELNEQNGNLGMCNNLLKKQTASVGLTLPKYNFPGSASGAGLERYKRTREEYRTIGKISKRLYATLSKVPHCPCHSLYLCLETGQGFKDSSLSSDSDSTTGVKVSVLVAPSLGPFNDSKYIPCQEILLEFCQSSILKESLPAPLTIPGLCGDLFTNRKEKEYIIDSFLVQHVQDRPKVFGKKFLPPSRSENCFEKKRVVLSSPINYFLL